MKANIFGKGKKRKKDKSGGKAGGGRGKNSGGGAGDAGSPKSRLSGQARRSAKDRERPRGRPNKRIRRGASVHDSYFRKVFSKKRYTPNIFKLALPEKLYNLLDWSSLEVEMKTFLSEEMRERRTDILCSVKIKNSGGRLGLLFLLEHRSHQGKDIHQILLEYQTPAYRALKMPIIPIVPYSGKRPKWTQPLDFHGSLLRDFKSQLSPAQSRAAAEVWDAIKGHVLNFRYFLLNLRDLDEGKSRGLTSHPALFILKHIWDLKGDWERAERIIKKLFRMGAALSLEDWKVLINKAVDYICSAHPRRFNWEVLKEIDKKATGGKNFMQFIDTMEEVGKKNLQKGLQKGRQKGRQEGRQEVIFNMLQKNLEISLISEVTGLPEAEIIKFKTGKLKSQPKAGAQNGKAE